MDNKTKFVKPVLEIIGFFDDDILTLSGETLGGENWSEDDNTEGW